MAREGVSVGGREEAREEAREGERKRGREGGRKGGREDARKEGEYFCVHIIADVSDRLADRDRVQFLNGLRKLHGVTAF